VTPAKTGPRKPAAKPRTTRSRAAAARAEKKPAAQTVDFRGLTLTVPPSSEWGSELYFIMGDDEDSGIAQTVKILHELIGADQLTQVREKLRQDRVPFGDVEQVLSGLFEQIFETFGTSTGESLASADS
jgi:hypothetical protein